jgi:hypothetical protein
MKQILLLSLFIIITLSTQAQCLLGVKAGAGVTDVAMLNLPSRLESVFDYRFAYQGGVTFRRNLNKKLIANAELLYALKGAENNESGNSQNIKINFHYLSLPLTLDYQVFPKFFIGIGPEISYRLKLNTSEGDGFPLLTETWDKKWDFGLNAEVRFYPTNRFYTSLRYTHGISDLGVQFTDVNGEPYRDIKLQNRALQLSLGYEFSLGKP